MMNLTIAVSANFRHAVRSVLRTLNPIFLEYFPIQMFWKRDEPSDWPVQNNIEKQGLEKYEYSLYSQNGEDGIIRYLFSEIGCSSKTLVVWFWRY